MSFEFHQSLRNVSSIILKENIHINESGCYRYLTWGHKCHRKLRGGWRATRSPRRFFAKLPRLQRIADKRTRRRPRRTASFLLPYTRPRLYKVELDERSSRRASDPRFERVAERPRAPLVNQFLWCMGLLVIALSFKVLYGRKHGRRSSQGFKVNERAARCPSAWKLIQRRSKTRLRGAYARTGVFELIGGNDVVVYRVQMTRNYFTRPTVVRSEW